MKPTKYRSRTAVVDGKKFQSRKESARYIELRLLERSGAISGLELQPVYVLAPAVVIGGRKKPALRYRADFRYVEHGETVIEDVKGVMTPMFRVKQHLMAIAGYEIRLV